LAFSSAALTTTARKVTSRNEEMTKRRALRKSAAPYLGDFYQPPCVRRTATGISSGAWASLVLPERNKRF